MQRLDIDDSGNMFIAGYTYGSFAGPNKGGADMFIAAPDDRAIRKSRFLISVQPP